MVEQAEFVEGVRDGLCNGPGSCKQKDTVLTLDLWWTGGGGGVDKRGKRGERGGYSIKITDGI